MTDAPLIAIGPAELGYCLMCRRPATVVRVAFKGWAHSALVCEPCVQDFANTVRNRVVAFGRAIQINPPAS